MPNKERSSEQIKRRKEIISSLDNRLEEAKKKAGKGTVDEIYYWMNEYRAIATSALMVLKND